MLLLLTYPQASKPGEHDIYGAAFSTFSSWGCLTPGYLVDLNSRSNRAKKQLQRYTQTNLKTLSACCLCERFLVINHSAFVSGLAAIFLFMSVQPSSSTAAFLTCRTSRNQCAQHFSIPFSYSEIVLLLQRTFRI